VTGQENHHPADQICTALMRASGILAVVTNCFDAEKKSFAVNTHYLQESVAAVESLLADASAALTRLYATCDLSLHTDSPARERAPEPAPARGPAPVAAVAAPVERPVAAPVARPVAVQAERRVAVQAERPVPVQAERPMAAPVQRPAAPVQRPVSVHMERPVAAPLQRPVATPSELPAAAQLPHAAKAPELFDLDNKSGSNLRPMLSDPPKFYFPEKPPLPPRSLAALARYSSKTTRPSYPASSQAGISRTARSYEGLLEKLTAAADQAAFQAQHYEGDQALAMTLEGLRADLLRLKSA